MKLMHPLFSSPICFSEQAVSVLAVERPAQFRAMAFDLLRQSEGGEGAFILSENDRLLECANCLHVVHDFLHLEAAERRVSGRFQSLLQKTAQEELGVEAAALTLQINTFLNALAMRLDHPVAFEQGEYLGALLKSSDFHFALDDLSPMECLIEHLSLYGGLFPKQCFALIGAKAFFEAEELSGLYKMAAYRKWNLLLLEPSCFAQRLTQETYRIIDEDLCEINVDIPGEIM